MQATLAAGRRHSVGLRRDGTVIAVGNGSGGELDVHYQPGHNHTSMGQTKEADGKWLISTITVI